MGRLLRDLSTMYRGAAISLLVVVLGLVTVGPVDFAFAQPRPPAAISERSRTEAAPRRRGLLDFLFGPRRTAPKRAAVPRRPPQAPPVATVEVKPKDPNARRIVVIGDFVAGGLAWGLDQTFAEESKLVVLDRANANSGIVRDDYYDWNARLPEILNQDPPSIVVVVVGANDRQQIRQGDERLQTRTESWERVYGERVANLIDTLTVYGRPFFWVSAPPMRSSSASRDMAYFNELYKPRVAAGGGYFVDIWNGFTNADGRFVSSGPDVEGQLRALRNSDGINFTRAGRRKLAFYVEREIRRQTGLGAGTVDLMASASQASRIEVGPDGKKRLVGPIISLTAPLPGAAAQLTGAVPVIGDRMIGAAPPGEPLLAEPADAESPQYLMIVEGVSLPRVTGRADDFIWPPRRTAIFAAEPVVEGATAEAAADQAAN